MPAKRPRQEGGSERAGGEDVRSEPSRNTSEYTMHQTAHAARRMQERELLRRELQACLKHDRRPQLSASNRWTFRHGDLTLITDSTKKLAITAYRGPPWRPLNLLPADESPFDLHRSALLRPPETPRSPNVSTPREDTSEQGSQRGSRSPRSRSRSVSVSRESGGKDAFVGADTRLAPLHEEREFVPSSRGDLVEVVKCRARVVHDIALRGGARRAGALWGCPDCDAVDNLAWTRCLGCGAQFPEQAVEAAKADARAVLEQPFDLAKAHVANPHRLGTMAGYVGGRVAAVTQEQASHPAAFADDLKQLLPPPPSRDECPRPDRRLLSISLDGGPSRHGSTAGLAS